METRNNSRPGNQNLTCYSSRVRDDPGRQLCKGGATPNKPESAGARWFHSDRETTEKTICPQCLGAALDSLEGSASWEPICLHHWRARTHTHNCISEISIFYSCTPQCCGCHSRPKALERHPQLELEPLQGMQCGESLVGEVNLSSP